MTPVAAPIASPIKMLRFSIVIFTLILTGCISQSEFYSPDVKNSERLSIGACGIRIESFVRRLDDGIYLEIIGQVIIFRIKKGATIKFISDNVTFLNLETNETIIVKISEVTTGTFPSEVENESYALKSMKFKPLDEISSIGQYQSIEMKWGEWNPWKSKEDVLSRSQGRHRMSKKRIFWRIHLLRKALT